MLTAPVPNLAERVGWARGDGVLDARAPFLSYFRTTRNGRVLMGSTRAAPSRAR